MVSRSRCGICEKTTNNQKQKLHLAIIDGEDKLQFSYYSYYRKDLNKSLHHTKVHEKWYNAFVENVMVSSDIEHGIISINDANGMSDKCHSSNVCNIRINDDGVKVKENIDEANNRFYSKTILLN
jgi:hypothetical protein